MNKYLIIDGNAVLHRAYYALPDWRNRSGEATAGVYGFLSMLLKSIEELKPTHLIIVFDTPHPTFRHNMYVGYQHNREKDRQISEDIWGQVEKLKIVFGKMGVPVFTATGFEADDVIGSIAVQLTKSGRVEEQESVSEVIIITGDRDLMQLVNDRVTLFMPQKGLSDNQIIDRQKVFERLGVWPEQVVDYKALVGDSSDNYPGVVGIGPKTAMKLIEKYGSFENIYEQIRNLKFEIRNQFEISKTQLQKLVDGYEGGELSRQLATIRRDVPVTLDLRMSKVPDYRVITEVFKELGYKSLVNRAGSKIEVKDDNQGALF